MMIKIITILFTQDDILVSGCLDGLIYIHSLQTSQLIRSLEIILISTFYIHCIFICDTYICCKKSLLSYQFVRRENEPSRTRIHNHWLGASLLDQLSFRTVDLINQPKLYQSHELHHHSPNIENSLTGLFSNCKESAKGWQLSYTRKTIEVPPLLDRVVIWVNIWEAGFGKSTGIIFVNRNDSNRTRANDFWVCTSINLPTEVPTQAISIIAR